MPLSMSAQVFAITARLIEEHAGLHYEPGDADFLADRLSDRASDLGLSSLLDYYYYLRYDPDGLAELRSLVEALVVHETYLFREVDALKVLVDTWAPEMLRERPRLRFWSAACATGEEPYTLAILLSRAGLLDRVEIVGSDISARALARARAGVYGGRSLRAMGDGETCAELEGSEGQGRRVAAPLRERIEWRQVNLIDPEAVRALGVFDAILCRNVLIYFADATVERVIGHLGDALRREGVLLVGASESLLRFGTLFECEERGGSFFYRRADR